MHPGSQVLLNLIGEVHGVLDLDEFRAELLAALRRAIPSDWVSLNDLAQVPEQTVVLIEPEFPPDSHVLYARLAHENPILARYLQTHDGRAYRFSDLVTRRELHSLALYREFYGPIGLEHQIAFTLPHPPSRVLAVALSRRKEDYVDEERDLLNRARPYLIQAYRNAAEHTRLREALAGQNRARQAEPPGHTVRTALNGRGLTSREREIIARIAAGSSNSSIAGGLGISERTVEKHLQNAYRKLHVRTRSEAAALAWSLDRRGEGA